jgi:hypothetical protein
VAVVGRKTVHGERFAADPLRQQALAVVKGARQGKIAG